MACLIETTSILGEMIFFSESNIISNIKIFYKIYLFLTFLYYNYSSYQNTSKVRKSLLQTIILLQ